MPHFTTDLFYQGLPFLAFIKTTLFNINAVTNQKGTKEVPYLASYSTTKKNKTILILRNLYEIKTSWKS
jgi:hypothetical protein